MTVKDNGKQRSRILSGVNILTNFQFSTKLSSFITTNYTFILVNLMLLYIIYTFIKSCHAGEQSKITPYMSLASDPIRRRET